jgi:hypothetical protein
MVLCGTLWISGCGRYSSIIKGEGPNRGILRSHDTIMWQLKV